MSLGRSRNTARYAHTHTCHTCHSYLPPYHAFIGAPIPIPTWHTYLLPTSQVLAAVSNKNILHMLQLFVNGIKAANVS